MTKKLNKEIITINSSQERERERELVIWALFDDAESSYKNGIKKYFPNHKNIQVHSIGINNVKFKEKTRFFYHLIDLSLNNLALIDQLKQLPKPDVILASPPCESWSGADCNGKMFKGIDKKGNWIVRNKKFYDDYNKKSHPVKRRYFLQKETSRIIGEATIGATIKIIEEFEPTIWVIENPQSSKTWMFQKEHWDFDGIQNLTYYSSYDDSFSLKPTIFKSNKKFNLKKDRIVGNKKHMACGNYSKRSSIPGLLIKDLVEQILEKLANENN